MKLDVTLQARRDIREIASFISKDSAAAARSVTTAIAESFSMLLQMPHMGAPRKVRNPELLGLRVIPTRRFHNYLIFYISNTTSVKIIRVLHSARDIETILH